MSESSQTTLLDSEPLVDFGQLFECQVARSPDRIAVYFEEADYTYAELNAAANRVAHELLATGPVAEQRIGICLDRSFDAIATMLGILKAGCAFVPLDPEFPIERLAYIVDDAAICHIVCDAAYRHLFDRHANQPALLHVDQVQTGTEANPDVKTAPNALAYIMYTSGSTGTPKGVQIEHQALAAYCYADIELYQVSANDRTLQFSTLNFDIAVEEIFPPLLTGSSIVVRPRARSQAHNELSTIIEQYRVTAVHLATAYWHEWVDLMVATHASVPETIRLMVVTGEKVSAEHYRRWKTICDSNVRWCNAYGPTEATVSATAFIPSADWDGDNMPIGKPLKRYDALIVNSEDRPVSHGETGELLIGGPALSRGYLNRPELNDQAFTSIQAGPVNGQRPNDHSSNRPDANTQAPSVGASARRYYRTGDLARWLPDGDIEFAGRIDHQIKLGSYRIEPGEIESVVNQHAMVLESLISFDEVEGKKYLIAYVACGSNEPDPAALVAHLRDSLPPYMVPTRFVFLPSFPKTINGKIDRKTLPSPDQAVIARGNDYAAARSTLENQLADIWAGVLNVPSVGIHDDFFALGGSSLLVTRVITQVSGQLGIELPVRDFFANPTIASIARHIQSLVASAQQATDAANAGPATGLTTADGCSEDADALSRSLRDRLPVVKPAYFPSRHHDLFGVRYLPVGDEIDHAVLICPAYGHEYARAHRNLQQLAIQLAQRGCHVLRFDYSATGNSAGDCEEASLSDWRHDVAAAATFLRQESATFRLSIVGIRLGATLANSCNVPSVDTLVLWDPITDGAAMCQMLDEFHDATLTGFNRFNQVRKRSDIDQAYGYRMTEEKRETFRTLSLAAATQYARRKYVIASRDYASTEDVTGLPIHWEFRSTEDEIYWHRPEYSESAFSSPEAYANILSIIVDGEAS